MGLKSWTNCFPFGFGKVRPIDEALERANQLEVAYIPPRGTNRGTRRSIENPFFRVHVVPSHTAQQTHLTYLLNPSASPTRAAAAAAANPGSPSRGSGPPISILTRNSKDRDPPGCLPEASGASQTTPLSRARRGSVQGRASISNPVPIDKRLLTAALSISKDERRSRLAFSDRGGARAAAPGTPNKTEGALSAPGPNASLYFSTTPVDGRRASMGVAPRLASLTGQGTPSLQRTGSNRSRLSGTPLAIDTIPEAQ